MTTISLEDKWTLTVLGKNVFDIPEAPIKTCVPSTVYGTLLEKGLMPDPYFRDNELQATKLMENDFAYETEFSIGSEERKADRLFLHFEGIDTLADIYLNGQLIGSANNMNRVWEYDITSPVKDGTEDTVYQLKAVLHSPTRFISEENEKCPVGASSDAMPGFPHIRKAACMFGWDWGPRLPDAGLFRGVSIKVIKTARIAQVALSQQHKVVGKSIHGNEVASVQITADVEIEWMPEAADRKVKAVFLLTSPDGSTAWSAESPLTDALTGSAPSFNLTGLNSGLRTNWVSTSVTVPDPQLWWPNGYGAQPLYQAKVLLLPADDADGTSLDTWQKRIGLRTMTVNTDPLPDEVFDPHLKNQMTDLDDGSNMILSHGDKKVIVTDREAKKLPGRNFAFEINGLQIFAMGADYIPEDNILTGQNRTRTDLLLASAQEAHFNCLRVWGGGYFLDDFFYDICDERGLLVWQDFMFACASYELDDAFEENVSAEIRDNVRRIRHHACLGLWCGNNEMETQTLDGIWETTDKQKYDYIKLYEYIIPKIVKEEDPATFYWPSSPSSGGNFDNPWDENRGDAHYWDVWHGNKPFTEYRKFYFRYLSEFGFQSFPCLKTVETFTEPEDRNIFSRVMEMHQRNRAANGKILNYLSATFLYPADFERLLYASQLLQADAVRYGIEHFRRNRGRCMGTVVWQLNDIWPVASWASIDYFGRWKALHYAEKRAFAPVMISCEEVGELSERPHCIAQPAPIEKSARIHVANETMDKVSGTVTWELRLPDSSILVSGKEDVEIAPLDGIWLEKQDFSEYDELNIYLSCAFTVNSQTVSENYCLFTAPKHFTLQDPKLSCRREGNTLVITSAAFAKSVEIEGVDGDVRLSDNFFDMNAGDKRVEIIEGDAGDFLVRSVYDIAG